MARIKRFNQKTGKWEYADALFLVVSGDENTGNGEDVFSPIATVTQTGDGTVISITDANGTTTATITNGKDGADGKSAYAYAQEAGFAGTEEEFAEKLANTGVSSWNDLTDKPFGDAVVTFDGNLDGKTALPFNDGVWLVKVSDKVLSEAECIGANVVISVYGNELTATEVVTQDLTSDFGVSCFAPFFDGFDGMPVLIVRESGAVMEQEASSGTYFIYIENDGLVYTKSFDALKQVKTIAPKFLPDMTDSINALIDAKLGVIENGSY